MSACPLIISGLDFRRRASYVIVNRKRNERCKETHRVIDTPKSMNSGRIPFPNSDRRQAGKSWQARTSERLGDVDLVSDKKTYQVRLHHQQNIRVLCIFLIRVDAKKSPNALMLMTLWLRREAAQRGLSCPSSGLVSRGPVDMTDFPARLQKK